jgi:hypothetical protein
MITKTNRLLSLMTVLGTIAVIGWAVWDRNLEKNSLTIPKKGVPNLVPTAQLKSKTATSESGKHAEITPDGRSVTLADSSGNTLWTKDIVETFGTNLPMYFSGKIDSLEIHDDIVVLRAGNEFIEVNGQNGEIISRDAH